LILDIICKEVGAFEDRRGGGERVALLEFDLQRAGGEGLPGGQEVVRGPGDDVLFAERVN